MKRIINSLIIGLLVTGCSDPNDTPATQTTAQTSAQNATQAVSLKQQLSAITQRYFALRPEIATYYGVPDAQAGKGVMSKLTDYSPSAEQHRREALKTILSELNAIDSSTLSASERVSLNSITSEVKGALLPAETIAYGTMLGEYGVWFLPYSVNHLSGLHVEFPGYMEDKFAVTNTAEAKAYLNRLSLYLAAMGTLIDKLAQDVQMGVIPPDFIIDKTIANLQQQLVHHANEHPLVSSFNAKLAAAKVPESEALANSAAELVETHYYPATRQLISALQSVRLKASHIAGIGHLPQGAKLYQAMIKHLANSDKTAEEIHQLGLAEVARITAEMDALLKKVGYRKGTVGERMQTLLQDPKYLYPDTAAGKQQLMADIQANLALVNAKLPLWFGRLPDQQVAVEAVPDSRAAATSGAFYDAPSQDGTRKGTFWISLYDMAALPSYSLQTLTYHETNPGHHLQTIIGLSDSLPLLSTIFYSNAAGEGWALYAERLAAEMGIYQDNPINNIGRLQSELHRAVRLVVDTGMHAKGWSREQAIDYAVKTEGIHHSEATGEIERYVVWPGQALGYKLGELKIIELREKAKQTLGDKFDIKVFHDRLLENGALPLDLLEQKIDQWLETATAPVTTA
ncbi:DUF885 domain-containing protein [Shewanella sp. CG12_big_fil_rev_8_21_14_0_65_47_15]|uniref:DUF885 domain-containing protein n=1 Tax=Shewanella sp. CG12_big_fil_rev_8_21_14_0_65_47_15 TaxID=1975537 RepID=UPI0025E6959E|nr:DUF885 domain-containing protein [Shewanella sp. CG12_big_fil_rev_8_21_14_0_65_47_15]